LARAVGLQRLLDEHRQYNRWRVEPFPMLWQMRLGHFQKQGPSKHVEKIHGMSVSNALADPFAMLLKP
jgi:hypothetical protein